MKKNPVLKSLLVFFVLLIGAAAGAQKPVNWTPEQLMQPQELATAIKENKNIPTIISVGPGALIPGSIDIGSVSDSVHLAQLNAALQNMDKKAPVVVYCGCCPFEHCPNIRPAIDRLKQLHFTNYKLLNLPRNLKTDWLDKGFPSTK